MSTVEIITLEHSLINVKYSSPAAIPSDSAAVRRRNLGLVLRQESEHHGFRMVLTRVP